MKWSLTWLWARCKVGFRTLTLQLTNGSTEEDQRCPVSYRPPMDTRAWQERSRRASRGDGSSFALEFLRFLSPSEKGAGTRSRR